MYQEILEDYKRLTDDNPTFAFSLMQKATAYKDYIGEQMTEAHKVETDLKNTAEAIKSKISIEYAPGKPTEGARFAAKEEKYLDALQDYTNARKMYEYLEIQYKILGDVAFQSYTIWNNASKTLGGK